MNSRSIRLTRWFVIVGTCFLLVSVDPPAASAIPAPLKNGDILVADPTGIYTVNPFSAATSIFSPVNAADVDFGASGVFATVGNNLVQIDPRTGAATIVSSGGFLNTSLGPLAVGSDGNVYVLSRAQSSVVQTIPVVQIIRLSAATGEQTVVAASTIDTFGDAVDLTIRPDGSIIVGTTFGVVYRVDPNTGQITRAGGLDHTRALDADFDGQLVRAGNIDIAISPPFRTICNTCPGEPTDVTWGLGKNVFVTTLGGLFLFETQDGIHYVVDPFSTVLHGHLTAYVTDPLAFPLPANIILVVLGMLLLVGLRARLGRGSNTDV